MAWRGIRALGLPQCSVWSRPKEIARNAFRKRGPALLLPPGKCPQSRRVGPRPAWQYSQIPIGGGSSYLGFARTGVTAADRRARQPWPFVPGRGRLQKQNISLDFGPFAGPDQSGERFSRDGLPARLVAWPFRADSRPGGGRSCGMLRAGRGFLAGRHSPCARA